MNAPQHSEMKALIHQRLVESGEKERIREHLRSVNFAIQKWYF